MGGFSICNYDAAKLMHVPAWEFKIASFNLPLRNRLFEVFQKSNAPYWCNMGEGYCPDCIFVIGIPVEHIRNVFRHALEYLRANPDWDSEVGAGKWCTDSGFLHSNDYQQCLIAISNTVKILSNPELVHVTITDDCETCFHKRFVSLKEKPNPTKPIDVVRTPQDTGSVRE